MQVTFVNKWDMPCAIGAGHVRLTCSLKEIYVWFFIYICGF